MARRGERVFGGRHYILNGRGTKEECRRIAADLRKSWRYVRVVPWNPFFDKATRDVLDDYAIFVFERRV